MQVDIKAPKFQLTKTTFSSKYFFFNYGYDVRPDVDVDAYQV